MKILQELKSQLEKQVDLADKTQMEEYMRNMFPYYGIKAPKRKQVLKEWMTSHKDTLKNDVRTAVTQLFSEDYRELHYCALDIAMKFMKKKYIIEDISFIENLLTKNSWWDTVDIAAKHILGNYLLQFPEKTESIVQEYSDSKNMWLNRTAIIYQLGYKEKTNKEILFRECTKHAPSQEFFIQKAIGWALREYGKSNPQAVIQFANATELAPLSKKEALRNLI